MILVNLGHSYAYEMENILRLFHPGERIEVRSHPAPEDSGAYITEVARREGGAVLIARHLKAERSLTMEPTADEDMECALARLLFEILVEETGTRPPWGVLTGVRPISLCRRILSPDQDLSRVRRTLLEKYLVTPQKADLALTIARREQALLDQAAPDGVSLYVSIPFCPSRCLYCSFVSHDIQGIAKLVPEYLRLLCEEIRLTAGILAQRSLRLQSVYLGGGTPTVLTAGQLELVMETIRESFPMDAVLEYTVEAGRPDTITPEKLAAIRSMGANRISVNPQTMSDRLLRNIGRNHTARETISAFHMARAAGFQSINMDLIAGLPGESGTEFHHTLEEVLALDPDSVTVHTLTVKRSSRLRESVHAHTVALDLAPLLEDAGQSLAEAGHHPYYLYRQKGAVGNQENIGYAKPGKESLYNAWIMEEVQTIFAVGAGAVTKLCLSGGQLKRIYNFKFPYEYINRFPQIAARKREADQLLEEPL